MKEQLKKLAAIADLIQENELVRLSSAQATRQAFTTEANTLRDQRKAIAKLPVDDAARLTGTDIRWQQWAEARIRVLSLQEAQAAAAEEAQKQVARKAFGRASVLQSLVNKPRK